MPARSSFEIVSRATQSLRPRRPLPSSSWSALPRSTRAKIPSASLSSFITLPRPSARRYSLVGHQIHSTGPTYIPPDFPLKNAIAYQDYRPRSFLDHWGDWNQTKRRKGIAERKGQKGKEREESDASEQDAIHTVDFAIFGEESILNLANYHDAQARYLTEDLIAPPLNPERLQQEQLEPHAVDISAIADEEHDGPVASTSSLDPLADFMDKDLLPHSPQQVRQLVLAAFRDAEPSVLLDILVRLRACEKPELESTALLSLLETEVEPDRVHAHAERRKARARDSVSTNRAEAKRSQLSSKLFYTLWERYWNMASAVKASTASASTVLDQMAPVQAAHILRSILITPLPSTVDARSASLRPAILRVLLARAECTGDSSLPLDTLAHFLLPHALARDAHLVDMPPSDQSLVASTDESLALLQEFLRGGSISAHAVKASGLVDALQNCKEAAVSDQLVRQAILRCLLSAYSARHLHHQSTLLVRYLDKPATTTDEQRNARLFSSICLQALQAGRDSGKWVQRVALLLVQQLVGYSGANSASTLLDSPEGHQLLDLFFQVALPIATDISDQARRKEFAAYIVWKALSSRKGQSLHPYKISLHYLVPLLRSRSQSMPTSLRSTIIALFGDSEGRAEAQLHSFNSLLRQIMADQQGLAVLAAVEKNDLLYTILTCQAGIANPSLEKTRLQQSLFLYECVTAQIWPSPTGASKAESSFPLESRNLVPLVELLQQCRKLKIDGSATKHHEMGQLATQQIHRFLRERAKYRTLDNDDITTAARAFFAIGERDAGFQVLNAHITAKKVPSVQAVNAILSELAKESPSVAVDQLEEAVQVGFLPGMQTFESLGEQMSPTREGVQAMERMLAIARHYELLKPKEMAVLQNSLKTIMPAAGARKPTAAAGVGQV